MRLTLALFAGLALAACHASPVVVQPIVTAAPSTADPVIEKLGQASERPAARAEIERRGAAAVPLLLANVNHSDSQVRWEVVDLLGSASDPRALSALAERATTDVNPHV